MNEMCLNISCDRRKKCLRYRAIPDECRQPYILFKPDEKGECKAFVEVLDKNPVMPEDALK